MPGRSRQPNGIPSVASLVVCLSEVRDRLPGEFDEQIITHLELCGEIPCYPFEFVVAQLQEMSDFESRRYLAGLDGLARKDRWGGAERRLPTLLNYSTDEMLPYLVPTTA